MADRWNVFSIGRRRDDEDQLTELLAWLCTTIPEVASRLVRMACDIDSDPGDVHPRTQEVSSEGRADLVLRTEELVVMVESKLLAGYMQGQLEGYVRWLGSDVNARSRVRALMTLTRAPSDWPRPAIELADQLGVRRVEARWADLHTAFAGVAENDPTGRALVEEFLAMLTDEGLIPMNPLGRDQLGTAWRDAHTLIRRFHKFLAASGQTITATTGLSPIANARGDHYRHTWQDFGDRNGDRVMVGFHYTDDHKAIPARQRRSSPIVFVAVKNTSKPNWARERDELLGRTPGGWRGDRRGDRAEMWRPAEEILADLNIDDQQKALAEAAGIGLAWLGSLELPPAGVGASV